MSVNARTNDLNQPQFLWSINLDLIYEEIIFCHLSGLNSFEYNKFCSVMTDVLRRGITSL
jgi:hypothetical protein